MQTVRVETSLREARAAQDVVRDTRFDELQQQASNVWEVQVESDDEAEQMAAEIEEVFDRADVTEYEVTVV